MPLLPTLELDAGFESGAPYAYYDVSHYDDGSQYAPNFISHDITAYGRDAPGLNITRGVQQIVTQGFAANAGTLSTVLDNRDRRFDPNHLSGPYVEVVSKVGPGVGIIAKTSYNAVNYTLFTGTADDFPQSYPLIGEDQVVDLKCTDDTQKFAIADLRITAPSEYSGERINRIISAVGYKGPVAISHGNTIISPLTSGTVSAWSHMVEVANAEWGDLYFSKTGVLTFRSRDLILSETRSMTSQATFGDDAAGTELRYSDREMGSPPIVNDVTIVYSSLGFSVNAQDTKSQARWDRRSLPLSLPINHRSVAQQYANWIIQRYGVPSPSFASITIAPQRGVNVTSGMNNLLPQAFGRELGDRITIKATPRGGGSRLSADCFIRGITHAYQKGVWLSTKFVVQDASWTTTIARYDVSHYNDGSVYSL